MPTKPIKYKKLCMDAALSYLEFRMRSEEEMRRHLSKKEYRDDEIEQTIERLKGYGYIDDKAFADEYIRCKIALRPIGRRALVQGLYRAGIAKEIMDQSLERYGSEQEQAACDALCQGLFQKNGNEPKGLAKTHRALLSKGFSYEMIRHAVHKLKEEDDWVEG